MKTLYFDCSSGISGNMTLGALIEIVGNENYLINELKKVNNNGEKYVYPEYESMKELAEKHNIPLKGLYKLDELK